MEAPSVVPPEQRFEVEVGLFVEPVGGIDEDPTSEREPISMVFEGAPPWDVEVELTTPGFEVVSESRQWIRLDAEGDSTRARFAVEATHGTSESRMSASFWSGGVYLGEIARTVHVMLDVVAGTERELTGGALMLGQPVRVPDLTVKLSGGLITVMPAGYQTIAEPWSVPEDLEGLLETTYDGVVSRHLRNSEPVGSRSVVTAEEHLRGLGRQLWDLYAPPLFKSTYWGLVDALGDDFRTILIISDQPMLPWELMIPHRSNESEERPPLGMAHEIGRWYNGPRPSDSALVPQPPTSQRLDGMAFLAPEYSGEMALAAQPREIEALERLGVPVGRVPGTSSGLRQLFTAPPRGVIHFAGHGVSTGRGGRDISLLLEDGEISLTEFLGLRPAGRRRLSPQPFVFYNACDVGRADSLAGFAEGWAPALLELGCVGYIGTLWPVEDSVAADFAEEFYLALHDQIAARGGANVAEAVRVARRRTAERGEGSATPYAYTYYGHPDLVLEPPP